MKENEKYLTEQIITYLGNKRKLLSSIEEEVKKIQDSLCKEKLVCVDLFSGSGIVARMLKQYSDTLYANDLENYSRVLNLCYLSNANEIDWDLYDELLYKLEETLKTQLISGVITDNYAPKDDNNIQEGERAFYTHNNAMLIDTIRDFIDKHVPYDMQSLFLSPLLYEASVHANTSGVFKGFYKSKVRNVGKFGGEGENALERIKGQITMKKPPMSDFICKSHVYQKDANELVRNLPFVDIIYIDPPYNQHPYGSNYFMLNTIIDNKVGENISEVAGIPSEWNKSDYNKRNEALNAMTDLITNIRSNYVIVSYSSDGFITYDDMFNLLAQRGDVSVKQIEYPTFRGSRNLQNREKHVNEYIFTVKIKNPA
jgi:adenine-specific DNA-methyltransferase